MSQAIWYFATAGEQHGPVTREKLQHLAQHGEINQEDLIWCEGMDDWRPASQIAGLITPKVPTGPPPTAVADSSTPPKLAERPIEASPPSSPTDSTNRMSSFGASIPLLPSKLVRFVGLFVVLAGLVLVMLAKGCDGIGNRYADRLQARSALVESQFDDEWDRRRLSIEREQTAIRDQVDQTEADRARLSELSEELTALNESMQKTKEELQQTTWRELKIAARDVNASNRMWGVWRETLFLMGSIVLTCGLLAVSIVGHRAERWLCLVIIAIITFSLYIGGIAWAHRLLP